MKFQDQKATKLSALNLRIEEVIAYKESLICERKDLMRNKMAKAEAKRQEHIEGIRKKAREEDAKLKEIAFINELNEQNTQIPGFQKLFFQVNLVSPRQAFKHFVQLGRCQGFDTFAASF